MLFGIKKISVCCLLCTIILSGCGKNDKIISLGNYRNLQYEMNAIEITEEEIEEEIYYDLSEYIEYETITGEIIDNDIVIMEIELQNRSTNELRIIDDYEYSVVEGQDEMSKLLLGKKTGDTIKYVPKDIEKGQQEEGYITIIKVSREKPLILSETFVKNVGNFGTVNEYKNYIKQRVYNIKQETQIEEIKDKLLTEVVENTKFGDITEIYTQRYREIYDSYEKYAQLCGISMEELLKEYGMTEIDIENNALKLVKENLVTKEICNREHIKLSGNVYESREKEYLEEWGYKERECFIEDNGEEYLQEELQKIFAKDFIMDSAEMVNEKE